MTKVSAHEYAKFAIMKNPDKRDDHNDEHPYNTE